MKLLGILFYVLLFTSQQEHPGGFRQLAFTNANAATLEAYSFRLAGPDDADKPTAWQGPLAISSGGKACEAHVTLVTAVYAAPEVPFVVVVTYSGSNTYVHFVATSGCVDKWKSIKAYTEGVRVVDDRLSTLPACDSVGDKSPALCFAGRVYKLTSTTLSELLPDESLQLTKKTLGVGFTGQAKMIHPKSAHARIVSTS